MFMLKVNSQKQFKPKSKFLPDLTVSWSKQRLIIFFLIRTDTAWLALGNNTNWLAFGRAHSWGQSDASLSSLSVLFHVAHSGHSNERQTDNRQLLVHQYIFFLFCRVGGAADRPILQTQNRFSHQPSNETQDKMISGKETSVAPQTFDPSLWKL